MITSTQRTNSEVFTFIAVQALHFCLYAEKTKETVKSRLLFKKIANFTGKLLQNYK